MPRTPWLVVFVLLMPTLAGTAVAQQAPRLNAAEIVQVLKPAKGLRTKSLTPGTGPELDPGTPGSGVIPDLRILFPFNSAELTPETQGQLSELGRALVSDDLMALRFELAGHTDILGSDLYNDGLSERRARAVADFLESRFAIDPQRLEARGYGKRHLIDPADPAGARNRRVEVVTLQ
jgi:outer membrane protein OmpA-like peptidoglycan-associated protein